MDMRMPVMGGLEATRLLRTMPKFSDIPIIALSASVDTASVESCIEAGCTEHLQKPARSGELIAAIRRYLRYDEGEANKNSYTARAADASAKRDSEG
jgi:hypothetical protein